MTSGDEHIGQEYLANEPSSSYDQKSETSNHSEEEASPSVFSDIIPIRSERVRRVPHKFRDSAWPRHHPSSSDDKNKGEGDVELWFLVTHMSLT